MCVCSRVDAYFGDPNPFNQTVFDQTLAAWTEDTINVTTSAAGRAIQVRNSQATNPTYSLSSIAQAFTTGESIAFILVFGDLVTGVTPKDDVVYWFGKCFFLPTAQSMEVHETLALFFLLMRWHAG